MYREYAAKVRENVVQESVRATFNHQWQISQACTAMTQDEINRIKMLEKTKDMLVCKLEKVTQNVNPCSGSLDDAQKQIDELTMFIDKIEDQIEAHMEPYKQIIRPFDAYRQ